MEQATAHQPILLTETEAAKILGFSPRTLQKWRVRGHGPRFIKISDNKGPVRYRPQDLHTFLADRLRRSTSDDGDAS